MDNEKEMVTEKTWQEFRDVGLLWWVNNLLHTFGWSIVVELEDNEIIRVYPARVCFRGFDNKSITEGYTKLTKYMKDNIDELIEEVEE